MELDLLRKLEEYKMTIQRPTDNFLQKKKEHNFVVYTTIGDWVLSRY